MYKLKLSLTFDSVYYTSKVPHMGRLTEPSLWYQHLVVVLWVRLWGKYQTVFCSTILPGTFQLSKCAGVVRH